MEVVEDLEAALGLAHGVHDGLAVSGLLVLVCFPVVDRTDLVHDLAWSAFGLLDRGVDSGVRGVVGWSLLSDVDAALVVEESDEAVVFDVLCDLLDAVVGLRAAVVVESFSDLVVEFLVADEVLSVCGWDLGEGGRGEECEEEDCLH